MPPSRVAWGIKHKLVLALHQGKLRGQLHVDHHANAAVQLKEGRRLLSGQHLSKDRYVLLAKLRRRDVRVQPVANEIVCLLVGQLSVPIGILFDHHASRVVYLPELGRMADRLRLVSEKP